MPKWLNRLLNRSAPDIPTEPFIGFALEFTNPDRGIDALGFPAELLDEFAEIDVAPSVIAFEDATAISASEVFQAHPKIEFHGGAHAEAVIDLLEAIEDNDVDACSAVLARDATFFREHHDGAYVPLVVSSAVGNEAIVRLLLKLGASPDAAGLLGMTPLHWSSACGHEAVVHLLMDGGADPSLQNWSLLSPPELAAANNHQGCLTVYSRFGINPQTPRPRTVLSRMGCL